MRLVTWNARKGQFAHKVPLLDPLDADICVIPEIAAPVSESDQVLWFGENKNQGMAVVAKGSYTLQRMPEIPGVPKYVVPVSVSGPRSFVLFAVWTLGQQPMRYVRAASTAIDMYSNLFASTSVVMLGDFNSNAIWNKDHPANLNHDAMVERLRKLKVVSAYHHHRGVEHGMESEHTFYLYGHKDKPYHIDYCFLPMSWANEVQEVVIGNYPDWQEHSDHRPLAVELGNKA